MIREFVILLCAFGLAACGSSHKAVRKDAVAESLDSNNVRVVVATKSVVEHKNDSMVRVVVVEETEVFDTEHTNEDGTAPLKERSRKVTISDTRVSDESSSSEEDSEEEEITEVSRSKESHSELKEKTIEEAKQGNRTVRWWIFVVGVVTVVCFFIGTKIKHK